MGRPSNLGRGKLYFIKVLKARIHIYIRTYVHTYIIGHYNLSFRITALLLTSLILYALIFYVRDGTYCLKSIPNYRLLRNFFMTDRFIWKKSAERKSPKKYFFFFAFFILMTDLLDYGAYVYITVVLFHRK